jgi:glycosyltransferase involved in cell wall biosynthesis
MSGDVAARPSVTAVHQVLPSLHVADASGSHTLRARDVLREAGYASEIFVEHVDPPLAGEAQPFVQLDRFVEHRSTVILYQLAVGSEVVAHLLRRREPLFVNYHNLTPADFFWKWAPDWLNAVESGRQQLHRLAPVVSHAIAVSEFNRRDLDSAGYRSTSVVPPFVETAREHDDTGLVTSGVTEGPVSEMVKRATRWLFVGKLLPHKAAHDVVKALALYRRVYDPSATLALVGGHPVPAYRAAVEGFAKSLGIGESVELLGTVSEERLRSEYRGAHVFVCLSDHEGFCFPLLEAMRHGVPVVAYDAGAVGDTLGDGGILLEDKLAETVASAVHAVVSDRGLRDGMRTRGKAQLARFDPGTTAHRFVAQIRGAIDRL